MANLAYVILCVNCNFFIASGILEKRNRNAARTWERILDFKEATYILVWVSNLFQL